MSAERTHTAGSGGPPGGFLDSAIVGLFQGVFALVRLVLRLSWWLLRHPRLSIPAAALGAALWFWGPVGTAVYLVALGAGLLAWRLAHPESFAVLLERVLRVSWKRATVYRARRWETVMRRTGLAAKLPGSDEVEAPRLLSVRPGPWSDRLLVQMPLGISTELFERAAPTLAHAFKSRECRIREAAPGVVWLELAHTDPLSEPIAALPVPGSPDLRSIAIGRREDGQPWSVPVLGTHILCGGAIGSGKGSVIWSTLRGLAAAIRDGLVEVWAIDPKGGMELAGGRPMFARFAVTAEDAAQLLADAVEVMQERSRRLAGVTRLHTPTRDEPLILVLIDEVLSLTAFGSDRNVSGQIQRSLGLLLSQGRAPGVSCLLALQDPRKEVLTVRELVPTRIALRLLGDKEPDMLLGDGARLRGARCNTIATATPGVGYVQHDGAREPMRVRAAFVSDQDIAEMAWAYRAPRPAPVPAPAAEVEVAPSPELVEVP